LAAIQGVGVEVVELQRILEALAATAAEER
jgi:hypothetical protein